LKTIGYGAYTGTELKKVDVAITGNGLLSIFGWN
jgi:hypothetical protein